MQNFMKPCFVAALLLVESWSQLVIPPYEGISERLGSDFSGSEYAGRYMGGTLQFDTDTKLCDPNVKQYTGYFSIKGTNKKYFFWFFESRSNPASAPTVAWLTGGPGCSSMLALFGENGPCTINKDGKTTELNNYSWTRNANMFWIDQPPGTGFSEGDADSGEEEVSVDMLGFLIALFEALPQYNRDFYVFGESYAGHYIPAITHKIYTYNSQNPSAKIHLKGMGIGNGLTDPSEQYKWYPTMAYNSTTAPQVVSEQEYEEMQSSVEMCTNLIDLCNQFEGNNPTCFASMVYCNMKLMKPYQDHGMNPYDMRQKCDKPPLCYDFSQIDTFLNDPVNKRILKADESVTWEQCNFQVNLKFMFDFMRNYHELIPPLLESGDIRVLIYVGDQDYICNWIGNKEWVLNMEWKGKEQFNTASDKLYITDDGGEIGKIRSSGGLTFLQVFQAGHMVPMDQPEKSLYMFEQFISGKMGREEMYENQVKVEEM
jgi:carboxypeptidase C (cathepsin A)